MMRYAVTLGTAILTAALIGGGLAYRGVLGERSASDGDPADPGARAAEVRTADEAAAGDAAAPERSGRRAVYDSVLARFVRDSRVDYAALAADRAQLDRYLDWLASVSASEFQGWSEAEQIAYLINAYNAYTIKTILRHYPIEGGGLLNRVLYPDNSIRQIDGAFDGIRHRVAGREMTLDDIEHEHLRKDYHEPRLHFALVCAAVSCPPLRRAAYRGERLDEQLDDQGRRFLNDPQHNRFDRERGRVQLSKILEWYGEDFRGYTPESGYAGSEATRGVLAFVSRYLPEPVAAFLERGEYRVEFLDYDWTLNDQAVAAATR